ncbi:hypothetical protein P7L78_19145 [Tistrella bauzanensis]|uniref:phage head-tail joining protein n=1 Tax=Tistrella TaxID=171436 RepID=UPI0031F693F4
MATADELRAQLESLRAQRATGVAQVRHGDRSVTYRTGPEIDAAIRQIETDLAAAERRIRRRVPLYYGRGL